MRKRALRSATRSLAHVGNWNGLTIVAMMSIVVLLLGTGVLLVWTPATAGDHASGLHSGALGWATGLLVLALGARHAFDADHIAAIDNTTRKLVADGKRALSVGFAFSLGHSTVVLILVMLIAVGLTPLSDQMADQQSALHVATSIFGPVISGLFLVAIALLNIVALGRMVRLLGRRHKNAEVVGAGDPRLEYRGALTRVILPLTAWLDSAWKIYPLGFLFGLGLDTASEVTFLALSSSVTLSGETWWRVLSLPLLFAAGMCFFDTLDGILMNFAYGWAHLSPARKVRYNIVVTSVSAAVALLIATIEVGNLIARMVGAGGASGTAFAPLDYLGFAMVIALAAIWAAWLFIMRRAGERRYDRRPSPLWPSPRG